MTLYRGIVENNISPNKDGKVQVRIYGLHTANNENSSEFDNISTEQLPWAEVIGSTEFGLISGIGMSSVLKQGTLVWLFLENDSINKPVIFGTCIGKSAQKKDYSSGDGFCDPDGVYPIEDRLNTEDINELVLGTIDKTVIKKKNDNLHELEVAQESSTYPKNKVFESESGHIMEFDDTEGNERVQIIHNSGSYIEMKIDALIEKAVNDKINIIMGELKEYIHGSTTIDSNGNVTWTINGDFTIDATNINLTSSSKTTVSGGSEIDMDASIINLN